MINVAGLLKNSLCNGPGLRYVLFVQGCPHHCEGCQNKHTWDFNNKNYYSIEDIVKDIEEEIPLIKGVTFSGGEPFEQAKELYLLGKEIKKLNLSLMCYSGYTLDEILKSNDKDKLNLLSIIDILIDGKFEKENTDNHIKYAGSNNQVMYFLNKGEIENEIRRS